MLQPRAAWERLVLIQEVLGEQPALARALRSLPLYEQLTLTLELLDEEEEDWLTPFQTEPLPSNVVPFRPRRG